jgi:serine/threonine protein phosphatase 1
VEDRIAVFGDVHGRVDMLRELLIRLDEAYPGIDIYSTGDLVDRGYASKDTVDLIIKAGVKPVRGNHDDVFDMVMNRPKVGDLQMHLCQSMKGIITAKSYGVEVVSQYDDIGVRYRDVVPVEHKRFFEGLPLFICIYAGGHNYVITHAGLAEYNWLDAVDEYKDEELELEDLIALAMNDNREEVLWNHKMSGYALIPGYTQIVGHLPVKFPRISEDVIMIDTGCGKDGHLLTAIILPDNILIQVTDAG